MKRQALLRNPRKSFFLPFFAIAFLCISSIPSCDVGYDIDWNKCYIDASILTGRYEAIDECSMPWGDSEYEITIEKNETIEGLCGYFFISNLFAPDSVEAVSMQYFSYTTPHLYVPEQEYQGYTIHGDGSILNDVLILNLTLTRADDSFTCEVTGNKK